MKALLSAFFILISVFGCATTPPPHRIENDKYINPVHNLSIKVPDGWSTTTKCDLPIDAKIIFLNKEKNGLIYLIFNRTFLDVGSLDTEIVYKFSQQLLEKQQKEARNLSREKFIKDIHYESYPFRIITNYPYCYFDMNCLWIEENIKFRNNEKSMIYKCQDDDTCVVNIGLFSSTEKFDRNRITFEEFINSISYENSQYETYPPYIINVTEKPFSEFIQSIKIKNGVAEPSMVLIKNEDTKSVDNDIETKLQKLKDLKEKGLITQEDYHKKKDQILNKY